MIHGRDCSASKHTLTPRQEEVVRFVVKHSRETGRPPTRGDIAEHFGFSSRASAQEHIAALEKHGVLKRIGRSRGLVVHATWAGETSAVGLLTLPIIGRVAAGRPSLAIDDQDGEIELPVNLFHPQPDLALRVFGDSMRDAGILPGDVVAARRTHEAHRGQIVVARVNEDITIKYFSRVNGRVVLLPANADFQSVEIHPTRVDFSVEAIVVGVVRRFG